MRTIMDGNAFYEIDEDCLERMKKKRWTEGAKESAKNADTLGGSGLNRSMEKKIIPGRYSR